MAVAKKKPAVKAKRAVGRPPKKKTTTTARKTTVKKVGRKPAVKRGRPKKAK